MRKQSKLIAFGSNFMDVARVAEEACNGHDHLASGMLGLVSPDPRSQLGPSSFMDFDHEITASHNRPSDYSQVRLNQIKS